MPFLPGQIAGSSEDQMAGAVSFNTWRVEPDNRAQATLYLAWNARA